jgi:RNA polymerase sigma-70 factor (ECF subfamily)
MLGSHEPAQDIAQDTFLKMMDRLNHREEPIENPRAWLYKVAGNLCLNELSKNTLHRDREQVLEINRTENSTPEDRLIENEKQDRVRKEIAKLKPEQQMLIMMYNDGLSYREMAEATGIKEQSVGKTLWRIIDNLSRTLKYDSSNPGK